MRIVRLENERAQSTKRAAFLAESRPRDAPGRAPFSKTIGGTFLTPARTHIRVGPLLDISEYYGREKEDGVLSDDQLVDLLKAEGKDVARRTVAKYRESLGIPSSVQRRRARALRF